MRYRKYHAYLDILGVLGLALALFYYYQGHIISQRNEELANLWVNVATDVIGIWLSVRIIDYIIQKNKKEESVRLSTVRNMRFLVHATKRAIEFAGRLELDSLKHEVNWAKSMFEKRRRYFRSDEINDVEAFYGLIFNQLQELEGLPPKKEAYYDGSMTKEEIEKEKEKHWASVSSLEEARLTAEKNILSETEED